MSSVGYSVCCYSNDVAAGLLIMLHSRAGVGSMKIVSLFDQQTKGAGSSQGLADILEQLELAMRLDQL